MKVHSPIGTDRSIIKIANKYSVSLFTIAMVIKVNNLSPEEVEDTDYFEEKVLNHLEYIGNPRV